jgi:ABC-2 type transport system permease protein
MYVINYAALWIIFNKFNNIQGWSFYEVMFLYNLNLFSYGVCGLFLWSPMQRLEGMVQQGGFDSMLTKPIHSFWHLVFRQFNYSFLGHVILAFIIFQVSLSKLDIVWSLYRVILLVIVISGGILIQSGIMILSASVSFWIVRSSSTVNTAIYGLRSFLDYPISIYSRWVQVLLTFIVPYAFVNFYPAGLFLEKDGIHLFHPILQYGTPFVGILLFYLAMKVWSLGVRKYQSTGS